MNLKMKIDQKKIFNAIYLLIFLLNLIALVLLFNFARKYVYGSIMVDPNYLQSQTAKPGSDLDLNKFDSIVKSIEERQQKKNVDDVKNVF